MSIDLPFRKFAIVFGLLLTVSVLYFAQNYIKFSANPGYHLTRSFLFNLIMVGGFALVFPATQKINRLARNLEKWSMAGLHFLSFSGLIVLYVLLVSLILYGLGFLSRPFHQGFFLKYFSNVAIVHLVCYLYILKMVDSEVPKQETLIEATSGRKKVKIKSNDILFVRSLDHYVKITTDDRTYLKKISMADVLKLLGEQQFVRIHRNCIVNKDRLKRLIHKSGTYELEIDGGRELRIGKTYLAKLQSDPSFTYL